MMNETSAGTLISIVAMVLLVGLILVLGSAGAYAGDNLHIGLALR